MIDRKGGNNVGKQLSKAKDAADALEYLVGIKRQINEQDVGRCALEFVRRRGDSDACDEDLGTMVRVIEGVAGGNSLG